MKIVKKTVLILSVLFLFCLKGFSIVYHIEDTWINWPGYTSNLGDEYGTPKLDYMDVYIENNVLDKIEIVLHTKTNIENYNSLFINTSYSGDSDWDDWDYFVHQGGQRNIRNSQGTVANQGVNNGNGLYEVKDNYQYTYVINRNRIGNPNGIDNSSLTLLNETVNYSHDAYKVTYDFNNDIFINNSFFIAYSPWCANDLLGGGETNTVPEPATIFFMLTGFSFLLMKVKRR